MLPARLQICARQALRLKPAAASKALQGKRICMPSAAGSRTPACLAVFQRERPPLIMSALGGSSQLQDLRQLLKIMLAARWASATCNQSTQTASSADRYASCDKTARSMGSPFSPDSTSACKERLSVSGDAVAQQRLTHTPRRRRLWHLHRQGAKCITATVPTSARTNACVGSASMLQGTPSACICTSRLTASRIWRTVLQRCSRRCWQTSSCTPAAACTGT